MWLAVVVQLLSCFWLSAIPWTEAHRASLSFTISQSFLKLMAIELWRHPTISSSFVPFSSCLQSYPASRSFSSESALHSRWAKYWSFSFNNSPSNEYSGLICFRTEWFVFLAVQRTLESLQHHSLKASILQQSDEACLCYRNKICSQTVFSTLPCCHIGNCLLI